MKKSKIKIFGLLAAVVLTGGIFAGCGSASDDTVSIVNVSYDPTRELYSEYNKIFAEHWKEKPDRMWKSHSPMAVPVNRRWKLPTVWKPMW